MHCQHTTHACCQPANVTVAAGRTPRPTAESKHPKQPALLCRWCVSQSTHATLQFSHVHACTTHSLLTSLLPLSSNLLQPGRGRQQLRWQGTVTESARPGRQQAQLEQGRGTPRQRRTPVPFSLPPAISTAVMRLLNSTRRMPRSAPGSVQYNTNIYVPCPGSPDTCQTSTKGTHSADKISHKISR